MAERRLICPIFFTVQHNESHPSPHHCQGFQRTSVTISCLKMNLHILPELSVLAPGSRVRGNEVGMVGMCAGRLIPLSEG
jgi:hypothetical protein